MVTSSTFTRSVFTRSVFERIVHGSRVPLPGVTLFLFLMLLPLETAFAQSTVATPVFSAGTGTYATAQTVSIVTPTSGATIRYTTNGSAPSDTTGTVYTEPVTVSTTTTLRAIAYLSGYTNSAINTAVITIVDPPGISGVSPSSGSAGTAVTISGSGFGATRGSGSVWLGSTLGSVVSWSDTQIVATVASMSASGSVAVQQGGIWSEMVSFTVNTPEISGLSPSTAAPEAEVTVSGSNFGSTQGTSQIWLGTAPATVQSWSDTEIVALVGTGALSGNARVLRGGVFSNSTEFTVDVLHLTAVDPNLGTSSTSVTITGTGFGSTQGSSSVVLGSLAATVTSWSDTEIVATVASSSLTGVAKVQRNGSWTNTTPFTVPSSGGVSGTLSPSALNLVVGDTHVIQALSSTGQPVTGLTWASSNTSIVSLSTADPPVLTAVAAGHATITAGDASADVTVSADPFPLGTVIWSNPGDGSGVDHIVPAVPSANGVADVFSFQYSGSIQALTGDGTVAWTVDASAASQPYSRDRVVADFDGGLVLANADGAYLGSLVKLDGITGETASTYTPPAQSNLWTSYVPSNLWWPYSDTLGPHAMTVHTDGTIFAGLATDVEVTYDDSSTGTATKFSVVGVDPATGSQKFQVLLPFSPNLATPPNEQDWDLTYPIVAGDGYAYVAYDHTQYFAGGATPIQSVHVIRISSSGAYTDIPIQEATWPVNCGLRYQGNLITNADTGALFAFERTPLPPPDTPESCPQPVEGLATITGTTATVTSGVQVPGMTYGPVVPALQAEDGSFVGWYISGTWDTGTPQVNTVAFDASGAVRWTVPWETPMIATENGGVIAESGTTYDADGNATGFINLTNSRVQSWNLNVYQYGALAERVSLPSNIYAFSFGAVLFGNPSQNSGAVRPRAVPQEALDILANADFASTTDCDSLMAGFASVASVTKSTLVNQLRATARRAREHVYNGPNDTTWLADDKFPNVRTSTITTVGQWFAALPTAEGLSQFNGDAIYLRLDDWYSWLNGWVSKFQIVTANPFKPGMVNYYGMGTVMHEILHKQMVGGGFTHNAPPDARDMDAVIDAVGRPTFTSPHNGISDALGKLCFGNLQ